MLTERQKAFCEYYVATLNATESAKRAGYSEKTAYSIGNENLSKPEIKSYIDNLLKEAQSKRIATMNDVLEFLSATMQSPDERTSDRIKSASLLGELLNAGKREEEDTVKVVIERKVIDLSGGSVEHECN